MLWNNPPSVETTTKSIWLELRSMIWKREFYIKADLSGYVIWEHLQPQDSSLKAENEKSKHFGVNVLYILERKRPVKRYISRKHTQIFKPENKLCLHSLFTLAPTGAQSITCQTLKALSSMILIKFSQSMQFSFHANCIMHEYHVCQCQPYTIQAYNNSCLVIQ